VQASLEVWQVIPKGAPDDANYQGLVELAPAPFAVGVLEDLPGAIAPAIADKLRRSRPGLEDLTCDMHALAKQEGKKREHKADGALFDPRQK
jgi:hypothetical protein